MRTNENEFTTIFYLGKDLTYSRSSCLGKKNIETMMGWNNIEMKCLMYLTKMCLIIMEIQYMITRNPIEIIHNPTKIY